MEITRNDTGQALGTLSGCYQVCDNTLAFALTDAEREQRRQHKREQRKQQTRQRRKAARASRRTSR